MWMRWWRACSSGLQMTLNCGEQLIFSRAGLLFRPRQVEGMGWWEPYETRQGQMQSPVPGRKSPCQQDRLGTDWLGSSSVEKALGALVGSKWDVAEECAMSAKLASSILDFMNRTTTSRARKGVIPLYLACFRCHLDTVSNFGPSSTKKINKPEWVDGHQDGWGLKHLPYFQKINTPTPNCRPITAGIQLYVNPMWRYRPPHNDNFFFFFLRCLWQQCFDLEKKKRLWLEITYIDPNGDLDFPRMLLMCLRWTESGYSMLCGLWLYVFLWIN